MAVGYACMVLGQYDMTIRKCTIKNANPIRLSAITNQNLDVLERMIDYNIDCGITLFRISSDIIPFGGHVINKQKWWEEHKEKLEKIGRKIAKSDMRVSMHPGQYTILNSPRDEVIQNAVRELVYHERLLSSLGTDAKHKIILHIGGVYGDKKAATEKFIENYKQLPEAIKRRLVIENDEKSYSAEEVCAISSQTGAPVVFDVLHHQINPSLANITMKEWIIECAKTWKEEDGIPKIHYSQQAAGERKGAHSQTIQLKEFLSFCKETQDIPIDIMLEVKDKNLSAVKCSYVLGAHKLEKKALEKEWARYKYLILSRSAKPYLQMRQLMKNEISQAVRPFFDLVEHSLMLPLDKGAYQNAALHVWGYFKDQCTVSESRTFQNKLQDFMKDIEKAEAVKNYLFKMAEKYHETYLLNSYYFLKTEQTAVQKAELTM